MNELKQHCKRRLWTHQSCLGGLRTSAEGETEEIEEREEMCEWPSGEEMEKGVGVVEKSVNVTRGIVKKGIGFEFADDSGR